MWYIVKTEYYKEREAIRDLLQLPGVEDIYFPSDRREQTRQIETETGEQNQEQDETIVSFNPVISGILFLYAPSPARLYDILDFRGYFQSQGRHITGNAHIFSINSTAESLDDILRHASISDEEMYRYKVCIEQCAAHTDDIQIINDDFARMVAENDTVMITDGPFIGQTGVIRQVKSHGVKDRYLFQGMGSFTMRLAGIRRYGCIVIRESAEGTKAQLPNTWRYIDYLQGRLQASYFADNAPFALRSILEQYNKAKDIEQCQTLLLREAARQPSEAQSREYALQAVWLQQTCDEELAALKSLSRFFQSADNSVATVLTDLIPDMPLRPFLTPTSGVEIPRGRNFILFPHNGFVELIVKVNLKEEFLKAENYPSLGITDAKEGRYTEDGKLKGKMRKGKRFQLSNKEYVYYAHIALRNNPHATGIIAQVNWGEFAHRYQRFTEEERQQFLQDLQQKGYSETHKLLTTMPMYDEHTASSGFQVETCGLTVEDLLSRYEKQPTITPLPIPLSHKRNLVFIRHLVEGCIPAAVEFWQRQRLLEWRHHIQRYVLLHNLPLSR